MKSKETKSKWHNISIKTKSFEDIHNIQRLLPIRASIPQVIEWLISVGEKQIKKGNTNYDNTNRISK